MKRYYRRLNLAVFLYEFSMYHIKLYHSGISLSLFTLLCWCCAWSFIVIRRRCLQFSLHCIIFIAATRETAFLHAISAAAITHELTLQCRQNRIRGCRCGKTRKQPKGNSDWQWGGCSDDIKFGERETRRFIDKLEKGNDARTAFNLHNNQVGRKVRLVIIIFFNFCSDISAHESSSYTKSDSGWYFEATAKEIMSRARKRAQPTRK